MNQEHSQKWQRNFRKCPEPVQRKLARISNDSIVVACAKRIRASEIRAGNYKHLSVTLDEANHPTFPERLLPPPMTGKFCLWNAEGREIVRKDLPMIEKTYTFEVPNYGDWSNGSHDVDVSRDVYQRDFIPPKQLELSLTLLRSDLGDDPTFLFRFRIEEVLKRSAPDFDAALFSNLNLLQETVGAVDVYPADAEDSAYLKSISVFWEILPPGERTETLAKILGKFRAPSEELRKKLLDRYTLLEKLGPIAYISGTSGFQRYFGAQFSDNLVVFENLEYGNAIYVMFEDWEELSKLSRLELLQSRRGRFERIVHRTGWKQVLIDLVNVRRRSAA